MLGAEDRPRDLPSLTVRQCGSLEATGDPFEPYRLVDADGVVVAPIAAYLQDLQACGRGAATQRSYGMDLLRWFRFLWTVEIGWDQATRGEARDFCRWMRIAEKPARPHWRHRDSDGSQGSPPSGVRSKGPNPVTGKPEPSRGYAPATVAHCETVLRSFYDFHLEVGSGPMVNPFPLARERAGGRAHAHHNPMEPFGQTSTGRYRPTVVSRIPRQIPDAKFDELFASLGCHRDRALVALWVSTGARASELLGVTVADADPGQQLITVIRKGSRVLQQLPASPDAFVWLRLYQAQMQDLVPMGPDDPLWWTRRRPFRFRALTYHAARAMFARASGLLGANWTIHDLRHSAAYRMGRDPKMALSDVQWVLGHAHLSTTQRYLVAPTEDVIAAVLAHHARHVDGQPTTPSTDTDRLRYRPESLRVTFVHLATSLTDDTEIASIDWPAAITALNTGDLACSGGESRMLRLAASLIDGIPINLGDALVGLDSRNLDLVGQAVRHINGHRQPTPHS